MFKNLSQQPSSMSAPLFRFSEVENFVVVARIYPGLLYPSMKRVTVGANEKANSLNEEPTVIV